MINPRWLDPAMVEQFASKETDHRLRELIGQLPEPSRLKVLDLGCAGGRNTIYLAGKGCDVHAVDLSEPMVNATRERLTPLIGETEAARRVTVGPMDDLSMYDDETFDLVVALGIYHQATSMEEWKRAVGESARVLVREGRLLSATFAPGTDLTGDAGRAVPGQTHLYIIRDGMPAVLLDSNELDDQLRTLGLIPEVTTETVEREHEPAGKRLTVNGLYVKRTDI